MNSPDDLVRLEDPALLQRYASGDRVAFDELVRRRLDLVYSIAVRQVNGDVHLAQDVSQSVFLDLSKKAALLARRPSILGWLFQSTRYAAIDAVRSEQRRRKREQEAHDMQHSSIYLADTGDGSALRPQLDQVLADLGTRDQDVLLQRYIQSKSFAEIGALYRISEDAARMRADRALDRARMLLERRGITSTAVALGVAVAGQATLAAPIGLASAIASAAVSVAPVAPLLLILMNAKNLTMAAAAAALFVGGSVVLQERANARAIGELDARDTEIRSLVQERNRLTSNRLVSAQPGSPAQAEYTRLRQEADGLLAARATPSAPASEILRPGKSSPLLAVQTVLIYASQRNLNPSERQAMARLFCLDDNAAALAEAFFQQLPVEVRGEHFRTVAELLVDPFRAWIKARRPQGTYSFGDAAAIAGDYSRSSIDVISSIPGGMGQKTSAAYTFRRFDDGWQYGPISAADLREILALVDPATGNLKANNQ